MQLSNELKAVAVIADMSEPSTSVTRDQCMSVDHFIYRCERKRDHKGRTYGANEPTMLDFSIRINDSGQAHPLYKLLVDDNYGVISFLFNATYSETGRLSEYEEAMAVEGFVVDIQEDFSSHAADRQSEEQVLLRARVQVRSITYIGQDANKELTFIK